MANFKVLFQSRMGLEVQLVAEFQVCVFFECVHFSVLVDDWCLVLFGRGSPARKNFSLFDETSRIAISDFQRVLPLNNLTIKSDDMINFSPKGR